MIWQEDGERIQVEVLKEIERKLKSGEALTGFERRFYKVEVGHGHCDYIPGADDGEERVIRNEE